MKENYTEWEKEFDLRAKNWREDFNFWQKDIKSFIKSLLKSEREKLREKIKKLQKEDRSSQWKWIIGEVLSLLDKEDHGVKK